jgi:hypothetical protein
MRRRRVESWPSCSFQLTGLPTVNYDFPIRLRQVGQGRGATFSSTNPYCPLRDPVIDQRIDYILIGLAGAQDRLTVSSSRLCFSEGQEGVFPSDHFGVLTELSLATEPAPKAAPEDS